MTADITCCSGYHLFGDKLLAESNGSQHVTELTY